MRTRAGAALAALLAAGCATAAPPATVERTCAEGILATWSTEVERSLTLEPDDGAPVRLVDGRVPELSILTGARVRVCGITLEDGSLDVAEYDLRSVDGAPAHLGTLVATDGEFMLEKGTGDRLRLVGVPAGLAAAAGRRVWVSVREGGEELRVLAWGVFPEGN